LNKKLNILLIAYYFSPDRRVGALRASYWYKNLPLKLDCHLSVITANEESSDTNVHFVPTKKKTVFSKLIRDPGLLWKDNVKTFLKNQEDLNPDVVIITGGPFMQFGLTRWLKTKYNCNVILDYRDPFAVNPGFKNNPIQVLVKKYFERRFNRNADALITVNKYCANIIELFEMKSNAIIQNGYDETVTIDFNPPKLSHKINFVYTGKFYFSPHNFIKAIEGSEHSFDYFGSDGDQLSGENTTDNGFVSYEKALNAISMSDVGVIQTYGEDFQSTTKLFDYIRCERPILIISGNHIERGSIYDELQNYPNVYWCKDDVQSIKGQIDNIQKHQYVKPDKEFSEKYSRGKQLEKLVRLIQDGLPHN